MPDTRHLDVLAEALQQERPLVLFLGQNAWASTGSGDPVLKNGLKHCGRDASDGESLGFRALLEQDALEKGFWGWLAGEWDKQASPEWLGAIASLPLNAIFTSSVDPSLAKHFRKQGRSVEVVLSKEDNPSTPRSRRNLNITHLFGRAGEQALAERPPRNGKDLLVRMAMHGSNLLSRMVETSTGLGVLLVDGYSVGKDWLSSEAFAGVLAAFAPTQVLWFGWDTACEEDPMLSGLAQTAGPIVPIKERLATAIKALELDHKLDLSSRQEFRGGEVISLKEGVFELSPETRFKTSTGATIVDDSFMSPLSPLGKDAEYSEFRKFHGFGEGANRLMDGIRRGFALDRTCEESLLKRVKSALGKAGTVHEPILVHGQSGAGKSVLLAKLAIAVREEKEYPVLFASRASRVPRVDELEDFCHSAEVAGATATLIICDSNAPESHYRDLVRGFGSRGRRVIVVGSAYRQIDKVGERAKAAVPPLVEVPAELDEQELGNLQTLLECHVGTAIAFPEQQYLLPIMYRVLPDVRPRLASGLAGEALVAEEHLRCQGRSVAEQAESIGELGRALAEVGLVSAQTILDDKVEEFLGRRADSAARVIDYVMMAGKLDCGVPVGLLMRAVGGGGDLVDVAHLFIGVDLFRWVTNEDDDIIIYPRLRLEAELISSRRLGVPLAEVKIMLSLLSNASPSSYNSSEMRFVLDVVHRLGPDGPYDSRYSQSYLDIAQALTSLRERRGVVDPRLMLQESTLRRRYLRETNGVDSKEHVRILEEAREIVDAAIDEFGGSKSPGLRRSNANLVVERAAIYGFRAEHILSQSAPLDEVWQYYDAARTAVKQAVLSDDEYYATDISLWVPSGLLSKGDWDDARRCELIADIRDSLEQVDIERLGESYKDKFEERRVKVAQALEDNELEEAALKQLEENGSLASYYLRARKIGDALFGSGEVPQHELDKAKEAAAFLQQHLEAVSADARCLRYLLKCRWIEQTGHYLFGGERAPLPTNENDLYRTLDLLERLERAEGAHTNPRTRYLKAVLLWRLKREREARDIWKDLSRETQYSDPRRIIRQHIWTGADGKPRVFHGRVVRETPAPGRYKVQVEDIRQEVEVLEQDFRGVEFSRGTSIPNGFHIVFNYIGPLAERTDRQGRGR